MLADAATAASFDAPAAAADVAPAAAADKNYVASSPFRPEIETSFQRSVTRIRLYATHASSTSLTVSSAPTLAVCRQSVVMKK